MSIATFLKSILIDKNVVITGSYNFSLAAEHDNAEDLALIVDAAASVAYAANWALRQAEGRPWQRL